MLILGAHTGVVTTWKRVNKMHFPTGESEKMEIRVFPNGAALYIFARPPLKMPAFVRRRSIKNRRPQIDSFSMGIGMTGRPVVRPTGP